MAGSQNTDRFDLKQGVEMLWRELGGQPAAGALRKELAGRIPRVRQGVVESALPGAAVAVAAIDSINVLLDDSLDDQTYLVRSLGSALSVSIELDKLEIDPPDEYPSWVVYELRGQSGLFEVLAVASPNVDLDVVSELRMRSGEEAMNYRYAMKSLLR